MERVIVASIEGYSGSSQPQEKNIADTLGDLLPQFPANYQRGTFYSHNIASQRKLKDWVLSQFNGDRSVNLLLVGKSLGGHEVYRVMTRWMNEILSYNKIAVVFVDAHAPFPHFKGSLRSYTLPPAYQRQNTMILNGYQWNRYPKGAIVNNADVNYHITDQNCDHWNIVKHPVTIAHIKQTLFFVTG